MGKRDYRCGFRLNEREMNILQSSAAGAGLSTGNYIRMVIQKHIPKPLPPIEYHEMISVLKSILDVLAQTAARAHIKENPDAEKFDEQFKYLKDAIYRIEKACTLPESVSDGNDKNMESSQ